MGRKFHSLTIPGWGRRTTGVDLPNTKYPPSTEEPQLLSDAKGCALLKSRVRTGYLQIFWTTAPPVSCWLGLWGVGNQATQRAPIPDPSWCQDGNLVPQLSDGRGGSPSEAPRHSSSPEQHPRNRTNVSRMGKHKSDHVHRKGRERDGKGGFFTTRICSGHIGNLLIKKTQTY